MEPIINPQELSTSNQTLELIPNSDLPSNLHAKILERVQSQKPHSKLYFQLIFCLVVFVLFLIFGLSIFSATLWVFGLVRNLGVGNFRFEDLIDFGFLEFLGFGVLGSLIVFGIYEKFEMPFASNKLAIILTILVLLMALTTAGYYTVENFVPFRNSFQSIHNQYQNTQQGQRIRDRIIERKNRQRQKRNELTPNPLLITSLIQRF